MGLLAAEEVTGDPDEDEGDEDGEDGYTDSNSYHGIFGKLGFGNGGWFRGRSCHSWGQGKVASWSDTDHRMRCCSIVLKYGI